MSEATFLLGQRYDLAAAVENARWRLDTGSIMWLTYRRDFAPMRPYKYDSDAGWGCMLRASQMLMAQALQRHALGRDWRARARGGPFSCGAAAAASHLSLIHISEPTRPY